MWKAVGPPLNLKKWLQSPHRRRHLQDSEEKEAAAGCKKEKNKKE